MLNEVVVDRGANPFLTKIECWERDRLITKARPLLSRAVAGASHQRLCLATSCRGGSLCGRASHAHTEQCAPPKQDWVWDSGVTLPLQHGTCSMALAANREHRSHHAGASGWRHARDAHREHRLLSGSGGVHGPPDCARHFVHANLPALALLPARHRRWRRSDMLPWCLLCLLLAPHWHPYFCGTCAVSPPSRSMCLGAGL